VDEEGNVMVESASETWATTNVSDVSYNRDSDIEDIEMINVGAISDSGFTVQNCNIYTFFGLFLGSKAMHHKSRHKKPQRCNVT